MTKNSNLKFGEFTFRDVPICCPEANRLLEVYGPTIRSLHLYDIAVTSAQFSAMLIRLPILEVLEISELPKEVIKNAIFPDEKFQPQLQLKTLILHLEYSSARYDRSFLVDLFKSSKNLVCLHIYSNYDSVYAERTIIDTLITEGSPSKLEEIKLSSVDDSVLQLLDTHFKASPLKIFTIGYKIFDDLSEDYFSKFLCAHNETWEKISFGLNEYPNVLTIPQMTKLKSLSIGTNHAKRGFGNQNNLSFGVLDWGNLFGNLVTLHLYDTGSQFNMQRQFNLNELFPSTSTSVLSLKNLELPPEMSCEVLRRVGQIFPNVLKLNIRHQQWNVLSELWTIWPLIKTLAISIFDYE